MLWYVKHRLRDQSVETFRAATKAKAQGMCRDLKEAGEAAWVQDERGHLVPEWDTN
jgi:hypothetical protein